MFVMSIDYRQEQFYLLFVVLIKTVDVGLHSIQQNIKLLSKCELRSLSFLPQGFVGIISFKPSLDLCSGYPESFFYAIESPLNLVYFLP
jgi:hypothetical protein